MRKVDIKNPPAIPDDDRPCGFRQISSFDFSSKRLSQTINTPYEIGLRSRQKSKSSSSSIMIVHVVSRIFTFYDDEYKKCIKCAFDQIRSIDIFPNIFLRTFFTSGERLRFLMYGAPPMTPPRKPVTYMASDAMFATFSSQIPDCHDDDEAVGDEFPSAVYEDPLGETGSRLPRSPPP